MKLYTTKFNCNQPTQQLINVPNYSSYGIGIEVEKNNQKIELNPEDAWLIDGGNVISADSKFNGLITFALSSGSASDDKNYTLSCSKSTVDFELSTVLSSNTKVMQPKIWVNLSNYVGHEWRADSVTCVSAMQNNDDGTPMPSQIDFCICDADETLIWGWVYKGSEWSSTDIPVWIGVTGGGHEGERKTSVTIEEGQKLRAYASMTNVGRTTIFKSRQFDKIIDASFNFNVNSKATNVYESFKETTSNDVKDIMAKDTVVLSGTYADNSTFNFTIPVVR